MGFMASSEFGRELIRIKSLVGKHCLFLLVLLLVIVLVIVLDQDHFDSRKNDYEHHFIEHEHEHEQDSEFSSLQPHPSSLSNVLAWVWALER